VQWKLHPPAVDRMPASRDDVGPALQRLQVIIAQQARGKVTCDRIQHLNNFIHKWTCGSDNVSFNQLKGALGNMGVSPDEADLATVFSAMSGDMKGSLRIHDFCKAMVDQEFTWEPKRHEPSLMAAGGGVRISSDQEVREPPEHPQGVMGTGGGHLGAFPGIMPEGAWAPTTVTGMLVEDARPHPAHNGEFMKKSGKKDSWQIPQKNVYAMQAADAAQQSPYRPEQPPSPSCSSGLRSPAESSPARRRSHGSDRVAANGRNEEIDLVELVLNRVRSSVLKRGCGGLYLLSKHLRAAEDSPEWNTRSPNYHSLLQAALRSFGLSLSLQDIVILWTAAATEEGMPGRDLQDFIFALYGPMSERRKELVNRAWTALGTGNTKRVSTVLLDQKFNPSGHPDVVMRRLHQTEGRAQFIAQFDNATEAGHIPRHEFIEYYASVSVAIPKDSMFEAIIKKSWESVLRRPDQSRCSSSGAARDVMVTFLNGSQRVVTLNQDLGKDIAHEDTVKRLLKSMGISNVASTVPYNGK